MPLSQDLPITAIVAGHQEGSPVATPLMISRRACETGAITSVADLAGKRVAVNAPGGTEYWLGQALATAGLAAGTMSTSSSCRSPTPSRRSTPVRSTPR